MPRKTEHVRVRNFDQKITMIAVAIVGGLIGAFSLGLSFAAKGGPGGSSSLTTYATDQVASDFLSGQLVREKGTKLWRTAGPPPASDNYVMNWQSKQAYVGFSSGTYRSCVSFRTSKPASLSFELNYSGGSRGAVDTFEMTNISSSNVNQAVCHDFVVDPANDKTGDREWSLYSGLRILNDAQLDITQSTLNKIN